MPIRQQCSSRSNEEDTQDRVQNIRFNRPLLEYGYRNTVEEYENGTLSEKPLLLYLPGFDGTFLSPFLQFPELSTIFDIQCMEIPTLDRSKYEELKNAVIECITEQSRAFDIIEKGNPISNLFRRNNRTSGDRGKTRPVYLAGESFGGILASDITLTLLANRTVDLRGLCLINPATCFDRSRLAAEGSIVAEANSILYPFALLKLLPLFSDEYSFEQLLLILQGKTLPSIIDTAEREAYLGRVALSLPFVVPIMPQGTFHWRLEEWLLTGCDTVDAKLRDFAKYPNFRTLIVAGEKDRTLPSIDEAERLGGIISNAVIHVVEGAGHSSTCGSRVDLAALFRNVFKELRVQTIQGRKINGRTSMKDGAAKGVGPYFGMEPRYDNATVGLNPLLYWSPDYYRKYQPDEKK